MLEIVAKRDSLIALLEEERQRWCKSSRLIHILLLQMHIMSIFLFSLTNLSIYPTFSNYQLFYLFIFFSIHIVEILINYCQKSLIALYTDFLIMLCVYFFEFFEKIKMQKVIYYDLFVLCKKKK